MIQHIDARLIRCEVRAIDHRLQTKIAFEGILVPLLIRPCREIEYEVIDGVARYNAALGLGRTILPCTIVHWDNEQVLLYFQMLSWIVRVKNNGCTNRTIAGIDDR